jgi:hypothetical protein
MQASIPISDGMLTIGAADAPREVGHSCSTPREWHQAHALSVCFFLLPLETLNGDPPNTGVGGESLKKISPGVYRLRSHMATESNKNI